MPKIIFAPSLALAGAIDPKPTLTVEAEYGSHVVEGTGYTAAHHGAIGTPYVGRHVDPTGRPAPCNDPEIPLVEEGTILVSHLDLDTIGGCLRATAAPPVYDIFPRAAPFWALAEFVDVHGPHRLAEARASHDDVEALYAWWAWAKGGLPRLPRDAVSDVTATVRAAGAALWQILGVYPEGHEEAEQEQARWLAAGRRLRAAEADLNRRTFVRLDDAVIVRVAQARGDFCSHLYATPDGTPARAVAALNTETGAITLSLAEPIPGVSCRAIVQGLWGPEAGGHDGIAGSPRERAMSEADLDYAATALWTALREDRP